MTRQEAFAAGPLALCDHEIARCGEYQGPDGIGALMGQADWMAEKELIGDPMEYKRFIQSKLQHGAKNGFKATWMPSGLFDFQESLTDWAVSMGRSAIFADCGLGKTVMEMAWAENVKRHTNRHVLIFTPLAVAQQFVAEGQKFGIEIHRCNDGKVTGSANIWVTNYEKIHLFDSADFGAVVCDESSAIKAFDGKRRAQVTEFMRTVPYRLLATATPAPNDYIELGTASEALGIMGQVEMLNRFFKNDNNNSDMKRTAANRYTTKESISKGWRFKGHAEIPFMRWVVSWARACRKPSDLGFEDGRFVLPKLIEREHVIDTRTLAPGKLFATAASNRQEELEERRRTIQERCEFAASLVDGHDSSVIWCHLNDEGDLLERLIPYSLQIAGSDSDDYKEAVAEWFIGDKCVCGEPWFGGKLASWQSVLKDTGRSTTKSIESRDFLSPNSTDSKTERKNESISSSTTNNTRQKLPNTEKRPLIEETNNAGSGTHPIPNSGKQKKMRSRITEGDAPRSCGRTASSGSASPLTTTNECLHTKAEAVPFAAGDPGISALRGSTLTTAIQQELSEDCSALAATSDSESLRMTSGCSSRPSCICGHLSGPRRLISKPAIFGFGINFQHCAHVIEFADHSHEQHYQGVRRCWRFGQSREVVNDIIATEGQRGIRENMGRKAAQADRMFSLLVQEMHSALAIESGYKYEKEMEMPAW